MLDNFVFVLDGDQRHGEITQKIRNATGGANVPVLFLPGDSAPEVWIWECLRHRSDEVARQLRTDPANLTREINRIDAVYNPAGDTQADIAKAKLDNLADTHDRSVLEICRLVVRLEAEDKASDVQTLLEDLTDTLQQWRAD